MTVCEPSPEPESRQAATLVTVYGGFGIPLEPSWDPIFADGRIVDDLWQPSTGQVLERMKRFDSPGGRHDR